jgi:hypothetical protein
VSRDDSASPPASDPLGMLGNRAMQRLLAYGAKARHAAPVSHDDTPTDAGEADRRTTQTDARLLRRHAETMPKLRVGVRGGASSGGLTRIAQEEREATDTAERISGGSESSARHDASAPSSVPLGRAHPSGRADRAREAPPIVRDAVRGGGRPLDAEMRAFFETRLGRDLSDVRIHDHAAAHASARRLNAKAYTLGQDIVFSAGRFSPRTLEGRRLLAHELTHAALHDGAGGIVRREIDINAFETDAFDETTIQYYLHRIQSGEIEDRNDSDDKARAVVKRWRQGTIDADDMNPRAKATLIREMQSGFTGDDDERAILVILLNSDDAELPIIFGPGGVDAKDLDSDFHGDEEDVLRAFFDRKFVGGRKAVLSGRISLQPPAPTQVPPQSKIPWRELARNRVPYDQWPLEARKSAERERKAANRRIFEDTPTKTTPEWWRTRDEDNELFRLQHPYREAMKDFFQRSTYLHLEVSSNPVKSGSSVTFSAYVSVPSRMYTAAGQVEFVLVDRDIQRIYGKDYSKKSRVFAPLVNGVARYTLTNVWHSYYVTAIYADTGNLIGDENGLRLDIEP